MDLLPLDLDFSTFMLPLAAGSCKGTYTKTSMFQ